MVQKCPQINGCCAACPAVARSDRTPRLLSARHILSRTTLPDETWLSTQYAEQNAGPLPEPSRSPVSHPNNAHQSTVATLHPGQAGPPCPPRGSTEPAENERRQRSSGCWGGKAVGLAASFQSRDRR
ncbi:hypothetical protein N657DRAFT_290533 [Parathielavia appendiculata]|uniref:Uncharacterized protein n=1 Tax=Parathielavia appendiculata TaxID=2587402 RepID=A0AAN6U415_9PEZI|nr:hypothetical protein N657DRAFT_290533 [Parathielavia appendiculata]